MAERDPPASAVAAAIERLAAETRETLRGRVSGLRIELLGGGLVLRGTAGTYYAKQLALHAVLKGTRLPVVRNEIEVV